MPELAALLPEIQPSPTLDPEAEKRRLFQSFAQLLARWAISRPVLFVLEDLHWSDKVSLELLHFLARRVSGYPILLVATYRSDEMSPALEHLVAQLNRERLAGHVTLGPLDPAEVETMLRNILSIDNPYPVDFLDLVVPFAEGNPFFVEEILKALVEAGDISYRDGKWQGRSTGSVHVPSTVQESVQRRAGRLPAAALQVLMVCAVAGQRFDFSLMQGVMQMDEPALVQVIKELIAAQLLVEQPDDRLAFRHTLAREALYAMLLARERKQLHLQIAVKLEELYAQAPADYSTELAYHYYRGRVWDKALVYCTRAAERAERLYALHEAAIHLSHAIETAGHLSLPGLDLLHRRSQIRELLSDFEGARADAERALETAQRMGDTPAEWQALLDLGYISHALSYEQAGGYLQQALRAARAMNDPERLGITLNRVGNWLANVDRPSEAIECHAEALEIMKELHEQRGIAQSLELLGSSCYGASDLVKGRAHCEQAAQLFSQVNDPPGLLHSTLHAILPAILETAVADPLDLAAFTERAGSVRQIAREMGWRAGEAEVDIVLAQALAPHGEYGRALDAAEHGYAFATETGHRGALAVCAWVSGYIYHAVLAPDRAETYLLQGLNAAREGRSQMHARRITADLASVHIAQGRLTLAASLLSGVLGDDPAARTSALRRCWAARAELALASGEPSLALQITDRLITSAPNIETHGPYSIPRLSLLRAQALASLSRLPEAETELRETLAVARRQGKLPLVWRIQLKLAAVHHALQHERESEDNLASARSVLAALASNIGDDWLRTHLVQQVEALIQEPSKSSRRSSPPGWGGLTVREREITGLIAQGKSNRAIADTLVISVKTAERHVANIMSKLGFNSRSQIAVWVAEKGVAAKDS